MIYFPFRKVTISGINTLIYLNRKSNWAGDYASKYKLYLFIYFIKNCIYDSRYAFKAHIYTAAAKLESNKRRNREHLLRCMSESNLLFRMWGFYITEPCVHDEHVMQLSSIFNRISKRMGQRRFGPTRSRGISFDCFIVVPVFPPNTVASHLSVLPHPVHTL